MDIDVSHSSASSKFSRFSFSEGNEDHDDVLEKDGLLGPRSSRANLSKGWISDSRFNILVSLNIVLSMFLVLGFVLLLRQTSSSASSGIPMPPYSPLREDGVVRYINTRYRPKNEFRSPNLDEVDEAWNSWLREHDHLIRFPIEKAIKSGLPESVELFLDPGYAPYGLAVYHQIHCLNRLRKTFHAGRYFPNDTTEELEFHKNHCLDMIRQSILCHGDVSLLYWWNQNYSSTDEAGVRHYTEDYLRRSPEERTVGAFAMWDTPVQCRDLEAIGDWVKKRQVDDDKYGGQNLD